MQDLEFSVHLVEKDYLAYNQFVFLKYNRKRSGYRFTKWIGAILIVIGLLICFADLRLFVFALPLILLGLFYCFGVDWLLKLNVKRNLKHMLSQGRTDTLLGDFIYRLSEEALEARSDKGYHGSYWHAFDRVEEDDDYLYIFTSSISAHIIPKRELNDSELVQLKELLINYLGERAEALEVARS